MGRTTRTTLLAAGLLALLGACQKPQPGVPTRPSGPGQASGAPGAKPQGGFKAQFTFSSWTEATKLIRDGAVVETVSGHGGFSLILKDHTWVRPVAKPNDPLPKDPMDFIAKNAPNAKSIKHSKE